MPHRVIVIDPLTEPVPQEWGAFVAETRQACVWAGDLLARMAWCSASGVLMAVVTDAGGTPCALFHARHVGPRRSPGPGSTGLGPVRLRPPSLRSSGFHAPGDPPVTGLVQCHLPPGTMIPGYAFHPGLDVAGRAAAIAAFERAVVRRLGRRCVGIAYRQVGTADLPAFRRRGRVIRPAIPEAVLTNEWDDLDDYFRALPSRSRKNLQRTWRLVQQNPAVRTGVEPGIDPTTASRLLHAVQARYQRAPAPVPALYYRLLSGLDGVRYFTYRDNDDDLLAYGLLIDDGVAVRCAGWGVEGDGHRNLYFDHFLRQIAYLVENGRTEMNMGKTMYELKERFGARLRPLHTVASIR